MQQALVSLSLSLYHLLSKFANSLDPEDLRRLAKPNQGQSQHPTLRLMPRKNIISHIGFEPMLTIRWVHSYLNEKQKFKQMPQI